MKEPEFTGAAPVSRPFTVSFAAVFAIAWPMTIAYMTTPLLGLVDTAVIGQLGIAAALGGLAVGAVLFDVILATFNFLRASTTGLVAQALGRDDKAEQQKIFIRAMAVALACGFGILFVGPLVLDVGLSWIKPSADVEKATRTYFLIRLYATPFAMANYVILGWLLGLGKAGQGLVIQIFLNGINIVFSIYLGLVLELGIEGVAWATVLGEGLAIIFGLFIINHHFSFKNLQIITALKDRAKLLALMSVNRDIMVRSFCLLLAFAWFTGAGARLGELTLASNAILMHFFYISGYFLDGFATAAEQLVGRAIGAHYRPAFNRSVKLATFSGFILAGGLTLVFLLAGPSLVDLLTVNEAVRAEARIYLPWAAITALVGVMAFQMDGVFIGATWSADMRNMMLLSLAAFLFTIWIAVPYWGNHGLWLALQVFLGLRGITLWWRMKVNLKKVFG